MREPAGGAMRGEASTGGDEPLAESGADIEEACKLWKLLE
jgi:hypothetical protein